MQDESTLLTEHRNTAASSNDAAALKIWAEKTSDDLLVWEAYMQRAADLGDMEAQEKLALGYEEWESGSRFEEAVNYYNLAANQGSAEAHRAFAKLHFHGFSVDQDGSKALQHLSIPGVIETAIDRRYFERSKTLAAAQSGDPVAMYTVGLWYSVGEEYETDGWFEYNVEKNMERGRAWIENAAKAGFAVASERLRQMNSSENVEGRHTTAAYGRQLLSTGDKIGAASVLWLEKMHGDFESQDILTVLEKELIGDEHEPADFIKGVMQHVREISTIQAAADDEWEYRAGRYTVLYTEYVNSDGAMSAAESVFRTLRSDYWDRFFLVRLPDQTCVVIHRPPHRNGGTLTGLDTIQEMCDRLLKEDVGWDEETGRYGDEEYLYCEALDGISKSFLQAGGDLRVTWHATVVSTDPEGAVETALRDLSEHRAHHQFDTQYRGFPESKIAAIKFTLNQETEIDD